MLRNFIIRELPPPFLLLALGVTDLVTKTDKEVEKFLIEQIKQSWPDHGFLAEESYVPDTTNVSGFLRTKVS